MSSSTDLSSLRSRYQRWVIDNPDLVSDAETTLKWLSYAVAGYMKKSVVLSELVYSAANLVTFLNDRILAQNVQCFSAAQYSRIEYILSTIETVEVFLELAATHVGGPSVKWAVIASVQILKTVLRLVLVLREKRRMLCSPIVPPLDRTLLKQTGFMSPGQASVSKPVLTVTLKRSGRTIRKIEGAPPTFGRDWVLPAPSNNVCDQNGTGILQGQRLLGEVLHVAQPMAHLLAMGLFGEQSWKPFLLSLAMDCSSHSLHGNLQHLSLAERQELIKRRFNLLNYLLRSPFYDSASKAFIIRLLKFSQENVPFAGSLSRTMIQYLPQYQQVYFYIWG